MNFTADFHDNKVDLIGPTQWQDASQGTVAKVLGVKPEDVTLRTTFLGGGFGRRIDIDFIIQAAQISKAVGKPVKLLWTREDDMTHDFYRPMAVHRLAAALDANGKPSAMTFKMTSQSVTGRVFGLPLEVQDPLMTEAAIAAYEIPATKHEMVKHDAGLARRLLALGQPRAECVRQRELHRRAARRRRARTPTRTACRCSPTSRASPMC